eukprot:Rmarinus@m.23692
MTDRPVLACGCVALHHGATQALSLRNVGTSECTAFLSISGEGAPALALHGEPLRAVPPQGAIDVTVKFLPNAPKMYRANIIMRTGLDTAFQVPIFGYGGCSNVQVGCMVSRDAPRSPQRSLLECGNTADFSMSPSFGDVKIGETHECELTVRNTGDRSAYVRLTVWDSPEYLTVQVSPSRVIVEPGRHVRVVVRVLPSHVAKAPPRSVATSFSVTLCVQTGDEISRQRWLYRRRRLWATHLGSRAQRDSLGKHRALDGACDGDDVPHATGDEARNDAPSNLDPALDCFAEKFENENFAGAGADTTLEHRHEDYFDEDLFRGGMLTYPAVIQGMFVDTQRDYYEQDLAATLEEAHRLATVWGKEDVRVQVATDADLRNDLPAQVDVDVPGEAGNLRLDKEQTGTKLFGEGGGALGGETAAVSGSATRGVASGVVCPADTGEVNGPDCAAERGRPEGGDGTLPEVGTRPAARSTVAATVGASLRHLFADDPELSR